MRAARVHQFGDIGDVSLDSIPEPIPAPDQVLVRVASAALNPIDYKVALTGHRGGRTLPLTLGFDAVGRVERAGSDVTNLNEGDRVCLMTDIMEPGTAADLVLARERNCAKVPDEIPDAVAAGLPLAGLTALQAWDIAGLKEGQSVFVHGGTGGVGHLAVQLAKIRGAVVYATSLPDNLHFLEDLGVDHPINYHATPPDRFIGFVDVVLDTQGGAVAVSSLKAMRPQATMVSLVGFQPLEDEAREDVRIERMLVEPRAEELASLVGLVADHRLRVVVQSTTRLEDVVDALIELHAGHTAGKRIIAVS